MPYLDSIRVFVRVVERGSITAGGRDLRLTPAVASNRIKELEARLGVRLFNRTTRKIAPTEVGRAFYERALGVIESVEEAEGVVAEFSGSPRGAVQVTAPLGIGQRIIAPLVPLFCEKYPDVEVRLRLSDRRVDILEDGLDASFFLGELVSSNLKFRKIATCERVLCAAPSYLERRGHPAHVDDLIAHRHNCLLLRYPRSPEYFWMLETAEGPRKFEVSGLYDSDNGDVLTAWALDGRGVVNKAIVDIAPHLESGALVPVLPENPPLASSFGCLYPHRKMQAPKLRVFIDFMAEECRKKINALLAGQG